MPFETRLFAKAALGFALLTFLSGTILTIVRNSGVVVPQALYVEHGHAGFVGFLVNMVIGVGLWMLPLDRNRYPKTAGRYPLGAPQVCFWLLNLGLIARLILEPIEQSVQPASLALVILVDAAAVAQLSAIILFVAIAWNRVRGAAMSRLA